MNNQQRIFDYQTEVYEEDVLESRRVDRELLDSLTKEHERVLEHAQLQPNLYRFIRAYRQHGFKFGDINPLKTARTMSRPVELDAKRYGLDSSTSYPTDGLLFNSGNQQQTLEEIEAHLQTVYSKQVTIEFEHILSEEEKIWIAREFEIMSQRQLDAKTRVELAKLLLKSQAFDNFLAEHFPLFKRFSVEGAESSFAFYEGLFSVASEADFKSLVIGMAHRGRLNLMVMKLDLPAQLLFTKLSGKSEFPADMKAATGDLSHLFPRAIDMNCNNKLLHVSLLPNPSHLELVDSFALGKARAKQMYLNDCYYSNKPNGTSKKVLSLLIHGDSAFAGQGVVAETFQMSRLPNYSVGGTIHLIINNQVGFTNPGHLEHSGKYTSDLAKGFDCPIIHVNGDHPELAYKAAVFATNYRNVFGKDIVVDLVCFRRWGHNELDDPTFTQAQMYKTIEHKRSVPDLYKELILREKVCETQDIDSDVQQFHQYLDHALDQVKSGKYLIEAKNTYLQKQWNLMHSTINEPDMHSGLVRTGFDIKMLKYIGKQSVSAPRDFRIHLKLKENHIKNRLVQIEAGVVDWSTAESLAFGSLLTQGCHVRLSGEDVGRGTFMQRHCMFIDQYTEEAYVPLNHLSDSQTHLLEVCNSPLTEEAVLGFEYGFSLDNPNNLVLWEAQYGDFVNGAQAVIDTSITGGESKWMHQSSIVLLLPHGYGGGGPEHTSCRIERFLQLCTSKEDSIDTDDVNCYITHPTTPASYFHLLRRQMVLPFRKPLIIATPNKLFPLNEANSDLTEMGPKTRFQPVLNDSTVASKDTIRRVIFVFGKHYYALAAEKANRKAADTAIVRVEELCPFPALELRNVLNEYKNAKEFIWAQEEHQNMGAWFFVRPRFESILGVRLVYAGRDIKSVPAVSITEIHNNEVKSILSKAFDSLH